MKRSLIVLLLFFGSQLSANYYPRQIQTDLDRGLISAADAVYFNAIRYLRPELLPARYAPEAPQISKCGTETIQQVRYHWTLFTRSQQNDLESFAYRPDMPESYVSPDGQFRVHYTREGPDSVSIDDQDASGVPDYVERAAEYLMESYQVEIMEMGLQEPPPDIESSGPEWDVYLRHIPGYYGWVNIDQLVSVNPDIYTTFMTLDNDYVHTKTKGLEALRVTIAHEFQHMIQYGYIFRDENNNGVCDDQFLNEAAATWMEDRVYDEVNDYLYYLPYLFNETNRSFSTFNGRREYGLCIWFHFLEKRFYGMDMLRRILNEMIFHPAIEACDAALQGLGNSFADQLSLFYAWNMMTGVRADTIRFYPEGHLYPEINMDWSTVLDQDTLLQTSVRATASRYFGFTREDSTLYTLIPVNTGLPENMTDQCYLVFGHRNEDVEYTAIDDDMQAALFYQSDVEWRCWTTVHVPNTVSSTVLVEPLFGAPASSIRGTLWEDADGNGIPDEGEGFGIPEVLLGLREAGADTLLYTEDDSLYAPIWTNADGLYEFESLFEGIYLLSIDESSLSQDFVPTTDGWTREIRIDDHPQIFEINFGFRRETTWQPTVVPNPFIPAEHEQVRFPIHLQEAQTVWLSVYSLSGFLVHEDDVYLSDGPQFLLWNGKDKHGDTVSSGVYLYIIESDARVIRRDKLVVVR